MRRLDRGRAARQGQAQRHPAASTALGHVTRCRRRRADAADLARPHRRARRGPVGEPRRGRRSPTLVEQRLRRPRAGPRPSTASATTWSRAPQLGRDRRVVLAGHLDTVPANGNEVPRLDGRHAARPRRRRHEGRPRGAARAWPRSSPPAVGPLRRARSSSTRARRSPSEFNGLRRLFAERPDLAGRRLRRPARAHRRLGRGRLPGHAARCEAHLRTASGPTRPGRGWGATPSTGPRRCWPAWPRTSPTPVDVDGLAVPRVAPGRAHRGRRGQQRGARPARPSWSTAASRPATRVDEASAAGRGRCSTAPTRSRC